MDKKPRVARAVVSKPVVGVLMCLVPIACGTPAPPSAPPSAPSEERPVERSEPRGAGALCAELEAQGVVTACKTTVQGGEPIEGTDGSFVGFSMASAPAEEVGAIFAFDSEGSCRREVEGELERLPLLAPYILDQCEDGFLVRFTQLRAPSWAPRQQVARALGMDVAEPACPPGFEVDGEGCAESKLAQCMRLFDLINRRHAVEMGSGGDSVEDHLRKQAAALDGIAIEMSAFELDDGQLRQFRDDFAQLVRERAAKTREAAVAHAADDHQRASESLIAAVDDSPRETALAQEIARYCVPSDDDGP